MKATQTILIGSPLLGDEAAFLRTLCADLAGLDVLIITNFAVGSSRQIDFLVVTPTNAVLIELKNYRHPVFGQMNGEWSVREATGNVTPDPRGNAWQQTLEESFALSDVLKRDQKRNQTASLPNGGYYKLYRAFVCFYPEIYAGSQVTRGDNRVRVRGYADVLDAIKTDTVAGWSIAEWEAVARRALGVSAATLEAAVDPRVLAGHAHLAGYRVRIETALGTGLAPLLESEGAARTGRDIITALRGPQHYLLHGPSGSAKTFHLHHLAIELAAGARELPFLLEAKGYRGGDFEPYLRRSLAPFFAGDPTVLLAALRDTGRSPVLLIDALNECAIGHREDLLRGALAFALRHDARIVLTAQDPATPLAGIQAEPVALALPCDGHKRRIYAYHARIEPTPDLDALCAGFETAYDLMLAGRCHATGNAPTTRAELYDRYVATTLPTTPFIAAALLRHIAGQMHERLAIALTRRTYDELAERFLTQHDAKLSVLDALSETRLIDLSADTFSFEHELLLTYFEAEYLWRTATDVDALQDELMKPRSAHLIEFVLPRITASDERGRLICGIQDPTILQRIVSGAFGVDAQATLGDILERYVDAAISDVPNWAVDFTIVTLDDGTQRLASTEVHGARVWSSFESRLAPLLAYTLVDPDLLAKALQLLDVTEAKLREEVRARAAATGFSFRYAWSETIRFHGGVIGHPNTLPCTGMLLALQERLRSFNSDPILKSVRAGMVDRASATPPSDFAIHLVLEDRDVMGSSERIAANLDLIENAWESGIGTHRLTAVQAFPSMRLALSQGDPMLMTRAHSILDSFTSSNIIFNSVILETKSIFETIPPPVSVDDALSEMRACIAPGTAENPSLAAIADYEKTPVARVLSGWAYNYLGRIFEDFFQGSYYEAYTLLDDDERIALLSLAAEYPDQSFHRSWILRELLSCDAPQTLPRFEANVGAVDFTSGFLQDEIAAMLIAIEACARWGRVPPSFGTTTPEYRAAFEAIGDAMFFAHRSDPTPADIDATRAKWRRLDTDGHFAAGAILQAVHSARIVLTPEERHKQPDLGAAWPEEIETVMLTCVERRSALSTVFDRHNFQGELIKHAIEAIGDIGSSRSLATLRALSEDLAFGADAVRALAALQRRGIGVA